VVTQPIIFIEAPNIDPSIETLNKLVGPKEFLVKQWRDKQIKLQTFTSDAYRAIIKTFRIINANYHTYQSKTEKKFKVVIKGVLFKRIKT
jgi:hypothetical protein